MEFLISDAGNVEWMPESWWIPFFALKGIVALVGVLMLIWHMNYEWPLMTSRAQRARYLCLLAYAVLVAGASVEQVQEGEGVSYRHLGSMVVTLLLIWVMYLSIMESVRARRE